MRRLVVFLVMVSFLLAGCSGMKNNEFAKVGDPAMEKFCTEKNSMVEYANFSTKDRRMVIGGYQVDGSYKVVGHKMIADGVIAADPLMRGMSLSVFVADEACILVHADKMFFPASGGNIHAKFEVPYKETYHMYYWYRYSY